MIMDQDPSAVQEPTTSPRLSVVVPVYNEEQGLQRFHAELLLPALEQLGIDYEIIYVNDGSGDRSLEILNEIERASSRVRVVCLSRNFGKEIATTAGLSFAKGDAAIMLDADGQHPPALIGKFLAEWQAGAQVVVGVRTGNEGTGMIKKWGSKIFYRMFNSTSGVEILPGSTDFRLIDREVLDNFLKLPERQRITRALIDWLGFDRSHVYFASPARLAGDASYSMHQLVTLAMNSFISLSLKPLYFFGWVGGAITTLSLLLGLFVLLEQYVLRDPLGLDITGAASLGIFVSFLVGIVLMSQAMLAAYVAHVHAQTQGRPLFVVNEAKSIGLRR